MRRHTRRPARPSGPAVSELTPIQLLVAAHDETSLHALDVEGTVTIRRAIRHAIAEWLQNQATNDDRMLKADDE